MKTIRVEFGGQKPEPIDYAVRPDGSAEVWVYDNITNEGTAEEPNWVATGVNFTTRLSKEEVTENAAQYFIEEEPEPTIADLVEAIDILTNIVLEGE